MADRFASFVVKRRWMILALFVLLCALSVFTMGKTTINYDFTSYLSESTMTRQSLELMTQKFGATETLTLLLENWPEGAANDLADQISDMEGAMIALYDPENDLKREGGSRYERIVIYLDCEDPVAFTTDLKSTLSQLPGAGAFTFSGNAAQTLEVEKALGTEIPIVMLIAAVVVIGVLFLTGHSYIEPLLFGLVIAASILLNMGTNFIFPSISFVTYAVCAILQLALCMDYSIMLLHSYFDIRDAGVDEMDAMRLALSRQLMPISSSALTTIAGLVSLMFMSFTIGFDIGIVLSKGIVISMLSVFTLMPALILMFSKGLTKTRHKPLPLGGQALGRLATKKPFCYLIPALLIVAAIAAGILQNSITYSFMGDNYSDGERLLSRLYGENNSLVALVPSGDSDEDFERQRALVEDFKRLTIENRPAVTDVASILTTGEAVIRYYTVDDVSQMLGINRFLVAGYFGILGEGERVRGDVLLDRAYELMPANADVARLKRLGDFAKQMFLSGDYSRLILQIDVPSHSPENHRLMEEFLDLLKKHYPEGGTGLTGVNMSVYDISNAFSSDLMKVNLITIAALFLIVCVSFRSFMIPLLLVCAIQGAAWINTSLSVPAGRSIFFISYLICLAIQMGATIDYGILLTTNYLRQRSQQDRREALILAMQHSLPTIFTSGLILFAAGLAIGLVCSVFYISGIGLLVASGAFFSLVMVLLGLPAMLYICDRAIVPKRR